MGTRSSIGFIKGGVRRSSYSQFDGYPSGTGQQVVDIINDIVAQPDGLQKLEERLLNVEMVNNATGRPDGKLAQKYRKYANLHVSTGSEFDWYCLLREVQNGLWIKEVFDGNLNHVLDDGGENQSYNYLLDFDTMTLQVIYYNGDLLGYFPLDAIPSNWQDQVR